MLEFFEERGFVRDRLIWRLVLPLDQVDWEKLDQTRESVEGREIALSTMEAEMADPAALPKFVDLVNAMRDHMASMRGESLNPVTVEGVQEALATSTIQPIGSTLFIAKRGTEFAAALWLRNLDEAESRIEVGIPIAHPENRTGRLTTALHHCALQWARDHGLKSVYSFADDRDADIVADCEETGFQRRLVMPIMEMTLPD